MTINYVSGSKLVRFIKFYVCHDVLLYLIILNHLQNALKKESSSSDGMKVREQSCMKDKQY